MGDVVANIAKGRVAHYGTLPAASDAFLVGLLKSAGLQADATLIDHDDIAAMTGATNDECDFTNYARKTVTGITVTVDDTNERVDVDMADQTWTAAGGAANNTVGKLFTAYDGDTGAGTDSNLVPLTYHDFSVTTDGSDLTAQVATAGFYRAS